MELENIYLLLGIYTQELHTRTQELLEEPYPHTKDVDPHTRHGFYIYNLQALPWPNHNHRLWHYSPVIS